MDDYLSKPIDLGELSAALDRACDQIDRCGAVHRLVRGSSRPMDSVADVFDGDPVRADGGPSQTACAAGRKARITTPPLPSGWAPRNE